MRGEYSRQLPKAAVTVELPPRARRIPSPAVVRAPRWGTTSACAENTCGRAHHHPRRGNYLRVRGEYDGVGDDELRHRELPPRARRILACRADPNSPLGTTSACAENTVGSCRKPRSPWNYLRVRGEYRALLWCGPRGGELPPRARRIQQVKQSGSKNPGTTSACAENTR